MRNLMTLIAVAVVSVSAMTSPALALGGANTLTPNLAGHNTVQASYSTFQIQSIIMPDGRILTIK